MRVGAEHFYPWGIKINSEEGIVGEQFERQLDMVSPILFFVFCFPFSFHTLCIKSSGFTDLYSETYYIYIYICWHDRVFTYIYIYIYILKDQVISKTQKMVLDAFLINAPHYKVRVSNKWSKFWPPLHLSVFIERGPLGCTQLQSANLLYIKRLYWYFVGIYVYIITSLSILFSFTFGFRCYENGYKYWYFNNFETLF